MLESAVQQTIRLAAGHNGSILWRNNNGACQTADGRQIRYGLGNDSPQMNRRFKSSDLIGITRRIITPEMVGHTVGLFTSVEVKRGGWKYHGGDREAAQSAWLSIINNWGGIGVFATCPEDIWCG